MGWGLLVHLLNLLYFVVKLPVTFSDVHDLRRLHSDILPIRPLSSRRHSAVLESSQRYDLRVRSVDDIGARARVLCSAVELEITSLFTAVPSSVVVTAIGE